MRNLLVITVAICSVILLSCNVESQDTTYHISGLIDSLNSEKENVVILQQFDPISQARTPIDTSKVNPEGKYNLAYNLVGPELFQVHFPGQQSVTLIVDEGQRHIVLNVEGKRNGKVDISGSPDAQLLMDYEAMRIKSYNRLVRPPYIAMTQASKANDRAAEIEAVEEYVQNSKVHRQELLDFTSKNIGTSVALYGTVLRWTGDEDIATLEKLVGDFEQAHPQAKMAQIMADKVARYKKVAVGSVIPELIDKTPEGATLDFKDAKGTYTLIDFWASWCRPCILQIPDLKEAQAAFADQGFRIFGVSLDYEEAKWKDAIAEYDLNWPHISDVQGWQSQHATNFNVTFVPFNLLVDGEGKIIAKNLHSKSLYNKLDELFAAS